MITLLKKELTQLQPLTFLWLAMLFFGYVIQVSTERIDEQTFGSWCSDYCSYGVNPGIAVVSVLIALITAYSLFPNEYRDSTIDFLKALPVSYRRIFLSKLLCGFIVVAGLISLSYLVDFGLLASNPESIGGRFYSNVWQRYFGEMLCLPLLSWRTAYSYRIFV